jgi:uncharacterized protein YyaL (SSP411 family)
MLYDNALLVSVLSDAYARTEKSLYRQVIEQTIDFVNRELRTEEGGFYSALDADSEGVEGKYYTWTWEEWQQATNGGNRLAEVYFGIAEGGNWEHTNILHEAMPLPEAARLAGLSIEEATTQIATLKRTLFDLRAQRIRPITDDKSLLSWNALMNHAITKAGITLGQEAYLQQSIDHMQWMLSAFRNESGDLMHVWKNGQARIIAKLDDYAYLMQAMIALGAATGNHQWIVQASQLCESALHLFGEEGTPFLYLSAATQTDIPVRKSDVYDGATPSANAVMAQVLGHLGMLMERSEWTARAEEMLARMLQTTTRYTYSFGHWATLLQRQLAVPKTVVVTGKKAKATHAEMLLKSPPQAIVIQAENPSEKLPLTADKKSDADSLIFVCTGTACQAPVSTTKDALRLL